MTMTSGPCLGLKQNPKATPKLIQSDLISLSLFLAYFELTLSKPFLAAQNIDSLRRCTAMTEKKGRLGHSHASAAVSAASDFGSQEVYIFDKTDVNAYLEDHLTRTFT